MCLMVESEAVEAVCVVTRDLREQTQKKEGDQNG